MAQQGQDPQGFPKLDIKAARALNPHTRTIQIQSILGGHSDFTNIAGKDQFADSFGIDPSLGINDQNGGGGAVPGLFLPSSGLLRPSTLPTDVGPPLTISGASYINWMRQEPNSGRTWVYTTTGSTYVSNNTYSAFTGFSDAGSLTGGAGNGLAYYDGYMYFATPTDIVRVKTDQASIDYSYWQTILSKAALTNTSYPTLPNAEAMVLPNHPMHRHSDGKLYIGDVSGGNGVIHVISTTAGVDNGSAFAKLTFGSGLWPIAIESYGSNLAIALLESPSPSLGVIQTAMRSKLAIWDTTSQSFNLISWDEYPDEIITALKNINGTLILASNSNSSFPSVRLSQYIGGYSFKDLLFRPDYYGPLAGGIDGDSNRIIIATSTYSSGVNSARACVLSVGLGVAGLSKGVFNLGGSYDTDPWSFGSALLLSAAVSAGSHKGIIFSYINATGSNTKLVTSKISNDYSLSTRKWKSQVYNIGAPFKITKMRFPFALTLSGGESVTPIVRTDEGTSTSLGTSFTGGTSPGLAIINNTNYPSKKSAVMRPQGLTGDHNFQLELQWTGSSLLVMNLPITIEYELIPD